MKRIGRDLFWFNLDHKHKLANNSLEANWTNGREELQLSSQEEILEEHLSLFEPHPLSYAWY